MIIAILGRQPALGLAELESLFGAGKIAVVADGVVSIDISAEAATVQELGGTIKLAQVITDLPVTDWSKLIAQTQRLLPSLLKDLSAEGKIKLGLSTYSLRVTPHQINAAGLTLKKVIKQSGRSVRVVPNKEPELNSAQVLHNNLTSELGIELLFIRQGNKTVLARTLHVQDIEAYAARDQARPARDAFVGMLPPKLAQIMIHLAVGTEERVTSGGAAPVNNKRILDPFCGTGVVLQEATLFGYSVYGSDLSEKMVRYSRDNLNWLKDSHHIDFDWYLEPADATNHTWQQPIDYVVCETYLGQPLSSLPKPERLEEIIADCNTISRKFLENISGQLQSGTRLCVAVPAWHTPRDFRHLPMVDQLERFGFTQKKLTHAGHQNLLYFRPDQIVARELLILQKM